MNPLKIFLTEHPTFSSTVHLYWAVENRQMSANCRTDTWAFHIWAIWAIQFKIFQNNKKIIFEYFRFVFGIEQTFIFFTALLELFCKKEFEIMANLILFWLFEQFVLIYIAKLMFVWLKDYIKQNCPYFKCSLHWTKKGKLHTRWLNSHTPKNIFLTIKNLYCKNGFSFAKLLVILSQMAQLAHMY